MLTRLDFSAGAHPSTPFRKQRGIPLRMLALPVGTVFGQELSRGSLSKSTDCTFFVLRDMVTTRRSCYPESEVKRDDRVRRQRLMFLRRSRSVPDSIYGAVTPHCPTGAYGHARSPRSEAEREWVQVCPSASRMRAARLQWSLGTAYRASRRTNGNRC